MPKFLVDGASLSCSMGATPGSLKVLNPKIKGDGKPMANIFDFAPLANITPFGKCSVTNFRCMPATTPWSSSSNVKIRGAPALNEDSCCMCGLGGEITPSDPGQSKVDNA